MSVRPFFLWAAPTRCPNGTERVAGGSAFIASDRVWTAVCVEIVMICGQAGTEGYLLSRLLWNGFYRDGYRAFHCARLNVACNLLR
jgi:hypothetical protein